LLTNGIKLGNYHSFFNEIIRLLLVEVPKVTRVWSELEL